MRLTQHAWNKARELGIDPDAIVAVVVCPDTEYPADPAKHPGCRMAQGDGLLVAYNPTQRKIITVYRHTPIAPPDPR